MGRPIAAAKAGEFTVAEVAEQFGVRRATVTGWSRSGRLQAELLGSKGPYSIKPAAVAALINTLPTPGLSVRDVAAQLGRSRSATQDLIESGRIPAGVATPTGEPGGGRRLRGGIQGYQPAAEPKRPAEGRADG